MAGLLGFRAGLAVICSASVAGCTPEPGMLACTLEGQRPATLTTLYFGRDIPGGARVSDADWSSFAASELAVRFPDGFTVLDGSGQWRNPRTGEETREATKIVQIASVPYGRLKADVAALVAAYRGRFLQLSVGVVSQAACASF